MSALSRVASLSGIGVGLAQVLAAVLPHEALLQLGRVGVRIMYRLVPPMRDSLDDNARHLLGPGATAAERRALAVGVLESFSRFTLELVTARSRLAVGPELFETAKGMHGFRRAEAAGRGIIGITLHMGNYEAGPMLLTRLHQPVAVVYRRDPMDVFERVRSKQRRTHRIEEIPIDGEPPLRLGVRMLQVLRRGGMLLTAGDVGFEAEEAGEPFDFLGGRARFMTWPARIALASGAPILPCFIVRDEGDRYHLEMTEPIFPDRRTGEAGIMKQLVAVYADYVRRFPKQWLILHRYWETS